LSRRRDDGDRTGSILASLGLSHKRVRRHLSALLADGVNDDTLSPLLARHQQIPYSEQREP
jgi:hypothetical protein